jgi:HD-like signal output (HDOD) protein
MQAIPSVPKLYSDIKKVVESETCSMKAVSDIITQDAGMTAKVLQLVNSAYFGVAKDVTTVEAAVSFLGVDIIQSLAFSSHVFSQFPADKAKTFQIERLGEEGMRAGLVARCIARAEQRPPVEVEQAFIAGLLHDTGILMLAANRSQQYSAAFAAARARNQKIWEAEQSVFGSTHAEVGAYLLGLWGFHETIIEAVALHHRPGDSRTDGFTPLTAVHVADALLQEQYGQTLNCLPSTLSWPYLDRLKLADRLPQWGIMAWNVARAKAA